MKISRRRIASIADTLEQGETQIIAIRRHPILLAPPFAMILAAIIVAIGVSIMPEILYVKVIAWSLSALFLLLSLSSLVEWYLSMFVITSRRVLLPSGPLASESTTAGLDAILNIKLYRSFRGKLIGYGDLTFTVAGEGERVVAYLPYPIQLYMEIAPLIRYDRPT